MDTSVKQVWDLLFEKLPLWLLVLTRSNTSKVIFKNWSCLSNFETFLKNVHPSSLLVSMFQSIGHSFFAFSEKTKIDCTLCCRSLAFLRSKCDRTVGRGIYLLDTPWHSRNFPKGM